MAHKYPLAMLANESDILRRIRRKETHFQMIVDQHVGSAVFSGSKKGIAAFEKLLAKLED